jgi:hypothetical protein
MRAQVKFFELLADGMGDGSKPPDRAEVSEYLQTSKETPPESGTVLYKMTTSPLLRKVYAMLGISIYYRFMNVFQVGSLGMADFEEATNPSGHEYGLFGYFATKNRLFEHECGSFHLKNPSEDFEVNVGEGYAIRRFLEERAPEYIDMYPKAFAVDRGGDGEKQNIGDKMTGPRPDSLRVIDLAKKEGVSVAVYEAALLIPDAGGYVRLALIAEVNRYLHLDNTDTELVVKTEFMIVWRNEPPDDAGVVFGENCTGLNDMMMANIWKAQLKEGVVAPLAPTASQVSPGKEERGVDEEKGGVEEASNVFADSDAETGVAEEKEYGDGVERGVAEEKGVSDQAERVSVPEQPEDVDVGNNDGNNDDDADIVAAPTPTPTPTPTLPEKSPFPSILKKPSDQPQTRKKKGLFSRFTSPKNKTKKVRISEPTM